MRWPSQVRLIEVGPRDGLQNEQTQVPTAQKVALVEALAAAGLTAIQATSFVHPKWVPQLADAEQVLAALSPPLRARCNALVPNLRGYQRALVAGVREVEVVVGVSDSFSRHNVNMGTEESFAQAVEICRLAKADGVRVRVALATSFGCPYEGEVAAARVVQLAERAQQAGADELSIADTSGVANPRQAYELFSRLVEAVPLELLAAHFHDTRGLGLACVVASLQAGITAFDASVGGLGGCPYCPGAAGNIATEDLLVLLHGCGIATGVDEQGLLAAARLAAQLVGHELPSHTLKASAGVCCRRQPNLI